MAYHHPSIRQVPDHSHPARARYFPTLPYCSQTASDKSAIYLAPSWIRQPDHQATVQTESGSVHFYRAIVYKDDVLSVLR